MKRIIKEYFVFSKKERVAIVLLLLLAAGFIALPYFVSVPQKMPEVDPALLAFVSNNRRADTPGYATPDKRYEKTNNQETSSPILFRFDPNTATEKDWIKLGVRPKTAATIIKYRSKGGRFRTAEDLRKIWGISKTQADQLIPFAGVEKGETYQSRPGKAPDPHATLIAKTSVPIDINVASAEEWMRLPCIGEVLANRIVHYRERIGGFSNIMVVKKIYGIADSAFVVILPFLKTDPSTIPKLNLNTVTKEALAERTGIAIETAKGVISYRQQYGRFKTMDDLRKIVFITDSVFGKISPNVYVDEQ